MISCDSFLCLSIMANRRFQCELASSFAGNWARLSCRISVHDQLPKIWACSVSLKLFTSLYQSCAHQRLMMPRIEPRPNKPHLSAMCEILHHTRGITKPVNFMELQLSDYHQLLWTFNLSTHDIPQVGFFLLHSRWNHFWMLRRCCFRLNRARKPLAPGLFGCVTSSMKLGKLVSFGDSRCSKVAMSHRAKVAIWQVDDLTSRTHIFVITCRSFSPRTRTPLPKPFAHNSTKYNWYTVYCIYIYSICTSIVGSSGVNMTLQWIAKQYFLLPTWNHRRALNSMPGTSIAATGSQVN